MPSSQGFKQQLLWLKSQSKETHSFFCRTQPCGHTFLESAPPEILKSANLLGILPSACGETQATNQGLFQQFVISACLYKPSYVPPNFLLAPTTTSLDVCLQHLFNNASEIFEIFWNHSLQWLLALFRPWFCYFLQLWMRSFFVTVASCRIAPLSRTLLRPFTLVLSLSVL